VTDISASEGSQPVDRVNAKDADKAVQQAVDGEQGAPQHGNRHRAAEDRRNVVGGTEKADAAQFEIEHKSNAEGESQF
jgi:hypothetical protein